MKSTKFLPVLVVIVSVLLSACSGQNVSLEAPAVTVANSQAIPVSAPLANALLAVNSQTVSDVTGLQNAYESVFQNVNPSVVTIQISSQVSTTTGRSRGFGGQGGQGSPNTPTTPGQVVPTAEGSGFIWDSAGHIVTNNHVVEGAAKIGVTFSDGSTYDAT